MADKEVMWLSQYEWGNYTLTAMTHTKEEGRTMIHLSLLNSMREGEWIEWDGDSLNQTAIDDETVEWL